MIRVCDDGECGSTKQVLARLPEDGSVPAGRAAGASFDALGQEFTPGRVTVTASLHGPDGALVARRQQTVKLDRNYPNGKTCDGDGYVSGSLKLSRGDRV